jgi:hypothetical protein
MSDKKFGLQPWHLYLALLLVGTMSFPNVALSFFGKDDAIEVPLTKPELQKINVNAGWAKGEDQTLIFELSNGLKGPIQCGAANVVLMDGKTLSKVFVPKFSIPGNAFRNASMPVEKGTMKSYGLICTCFKKKGSDECVKPV